MLVQMKSIAELENRLPESPRLGSSSFRSTSPRPSSSAVAISDNRALLLEISAHLHHGLGALRADTEALRQDAEVLRRVFPQVQRGRMASNHVSNTRI